MIIIGGFVCLSSANNINDCWLYVEIKSMPFLYKSDGAYLCKFSLLILFGYTRFAMSPCDSTVRFTHSLEVICSVACWANLAGNKATRRHMLTLEFLSLSLSLYIRFIGYTNMSGSAQYCAQLHCKIIHLICNNSISTAYY